ncbi:NTPase [Drechmeria coniospora]|uniref:inosine/xanthosine triphosphatase n=1 Tax=Drechmeria coniospora TaxID=98403 RepID=A0A151GJP6_DRECN|nr:NTPase [Drechmeria coniospora]KYK57353.1 NTPase [Drechmeria coniospora]ODA79247.1 hypothetical protein RJ55_04840 [Drechmeria coniospora]
MGSPSATPSVVVISSKNPVKIAAARDGFSRIFPGTTFDVRAISVPSGVPDQPFSDDETFRGALNRANRARDDLPNADYWVGIEGGVHVHCRAPASGTETETERDTRKIDKRETQAGPIESFAWVVVLDKAGRLGKARTAAYYLPEETAKLLRDGMELGHADDLVHGRTNSKQHSGSVGILTDDAVDRASYYTQAVILALIPFKNPRLTFA